MARKTKKGASGSFLTSILRSKVYSSTVKLPMALSILGIVLIAAIWAILDSSTKTSLLQSFQVRGTQSVETIYKLANSTDVINEDGDTVVVGGSPAWIGTGESTSHSFLGLRFSGGILPAGAVVTSARLRLTLPQDSWINVGVDIGAELSANPESFSMNAKASVRPVGEKDSYYEDVKWLANKQYDIDVTKAIGAIVNISGRANDSPIVLVIKGQPWQWGRKYFISKPNQSNSAQLVVRYTTQEQLGPTNTPQYANTSTPSVRQTLTPTIFLTATPRRFRTRTPTRAPTSTPTPTISPTSTPTPTHAHAHTPAPGGMGFEDSMAMYAWGRNGKNAPNPKYDYCEDGTDIVVAHNQYYVVAYDGKKYPAWHPPVVINPVTGRGKCYFGHEHGRNPSNYQYYSELVQHFGRDINGDGVISAQIVSQDGRIIRNDMAGIPFGFVNQKMDEQFSGSMMRHEDHVGHKIEFANGEGDIGDGTDPFDSNMTGGVVVPVKTNNQTTKWVASGVRCHHLHKVHQGVSTPDALTNNLHEVIMHEKCTGTRGQFRPSTTIISGMMAFGAPGEFIRFCGHDRFKPVVLGTDSSNRNFPGVRGRGMRNIITRDCVEQEVLVPEGQFSSFPYEIWDGFIELYRPDGSLIARNGGGWEVLDAIRYYNPNSPNRISYTVTWCYEVLGNRRARGGQCDSMTNYGSIRDITWDDRRSHFRGLKRGQYVDVHTINNQAGPLLWYCDVFGKNCRTSAYTGSVKQYVSSVNAVRDWDSDPRIIARTHDSGGNTVHAPN